VADTTGTPGRAPGDQRLSRPFEALRDTELPLVLGSAIWHARQGATAYLIISVNGEWSIKAVPSGEACTPREERGQVAVPIPVAPGAAALADEDLVGLSIEAVYHHCVGTKAEAAALEQELAARFYRALYGQEEDGGEEMPYSGSRLPRGGPFPRPQAAW